MVDGELGGAGDAITNDFADHRLARMADQLVGKADMISNAVQQCLETHAIKIKKRDLLASTMSLDCNGPPIAVIEFNRTQSLSLLLNHDNSAGCG